MIKKLILVLLMLSVAVNGYSATITRYVNTASSGGDGTTNATSGANAAYASLSAFEAAEDTDLDTANNNIIVNCSGTTADTTAVTFAGWTTSATDDITINGNNPGGVFSASYYRLETANATCITINGVGDGTKHINFNQLQLNPSRSTGGNASGINIDSLPNATAEFNFTRCIVYGGSNTNNGGYAFYLGGNVGGCTATFNIINCIGYGFDRDGMVGGLVASNFSGNTINVVNSVSCDNAYYSIDNIAGTMTMTNCAVFNNADDTRGTITITYCAGDDAEFDSGTGNIGLDNSSTSWNANFTNYGSGDFSVKDINADIYDAGTDLSVYFTTDITGGTRTTWDIGAFEFQTAVASTSQVIMVSE
jgi:hypothetical protein